MSFDVTTTKLGEVTSLIARGVTPSYTEKKKTVVLNQKCIRNNQIDLNLARYTDSEKKKISEEKYIKPFDILVNSTGVGTLGRIAQVKYVNSPTTADSHITIVRPSENIDPIFLGYSLLSQQRLIESMGEGSTGQTELSRIRLAEEIVLRVPSRVEQEQIGQLLLCIDDKIELNNAINKNLEEVAQALFKRWFVDFEFPNENGEPYKSSGGEFEESELGLIPKGWRVGTLSEICENIFSGGTPSTKNELFWNGEYNWLSSGETRSSYIVSTEKSITRMGVDNSSTRLAHKYDVVIASAGQGATRGQTSICLIDTYINQSVISLRVKPNKSFPSFLFYNLKNRYDELRQISDSNSIRGSLTTNMLKKLKIIIPPYKIQDDICTVLAKIIDCSEYYIKQNNNLSLIRDTLLPKLMSGEIRVPLDQA
ncbi:restriction endonuclease subunit S [Paenibacillus thiaminolyticus]|uniref:restriction endonuclease subunit S n=1 Tax=Paenibacillus thiaminolyticus TaxID=49283 RepID=UPI003D28D164